MSELERRIQRAISAGSGGQPDDEGNSSAAEALQGALSAAERTMRVTRVVADTQVKDQVPPGTFHAGNRNLA